MGVPQAASGLTLMYELTPPPKCKPTATMEDKVLAVVTT